MNIKLKNIGIISDSTIEINGLTVITGHNNSGKTTVGKVIYSLVDAVSDIENKAANDKYSYVLEQLKAAYGELTCAVLINRGKENIESECMRIFFSKDYSAYIARDEVEKYLIDLLDEMQFFSIDNEPYKTIITEGPVWSKLEVDMEEFVNEKERCIVILRKTLDEITRDKELINYAEQSINGTLSVEFAGQIQPVALKNIFSTIEMTEGKKKCFAMELYDNQIVKSNQPVFNWMPYKNTYFIDNPFIVGDSAFVRRLTRYAAPKGTYVDENHILNHEHKLRMVVNRPTKKNVFETGIIEEKYSGIKQKIDDILPGEFIYTSEGRFYVNDGVGLKTSNLATGSKMFSIIKLLLEKGEITEKTLLVLDEPEAHLHPKWQNLFAEIIVLLAKEVGCHILLTTHSPNFMLGIEANMRKYDAKDICNFYQTKHIENSTFVEYKCVNDSLEDIYEDFVTYLSDVKLLRDSYM